MISVAVLELAPFSTAPLRCTTALELTVMSRMGYIANLDQVSRAWSSRQGITASPKHRRTSGAHA